MSPHVLVAEDEPLIMALVRATLAPVAADVAEATTGPQAVAAVRSRRPDLLLLDVGLPELDGYAVCRLVRALPDGDAVRIVLLTARARPADLETGMACGADEIVTKPFSPGELRRRVRGWLA